MIHRRLTTIAPRPGAAEPAFGGLYVHIPFCARKCPYCAFWSRGDQDLPVRREWFAALRREWARRRDTEPGLASWRPATIFFGGGTPTFLEPGELDELCGWIRATFDLSGLVEWSVEANPGTLTPQKAAILRHHGVTRLSLGVQSLNPHALATLGRIHGPDEARAAVAIARDAGFPHLGADWMYGLPGLPETAARHDLETLAALPGLDHLSCYALEVEPGTPFAHRRVRTDDRLQRRLYEFARRALRAAGFSHYELSNFARPGAECRHNLLYWSGGAYLGLGPAAASHWHGVRSANSRDLVRWRRAFSESLPPAQKACETLVFGLRRLPGWTRAEFAAATGGFDWTTLRGPEIAALVRNRLLVETSSRLRLSTRALFVSDSVFRALI